MVIDDAAFGFDMDSNKTHIGNFYIFLATIYNMIDLKLDRTPIIDPKGQVQGYVRYSLSLQVFDGDVEVPDLIEYETFNELIGKKLKLNFEIKEGEQLPKKLSTRTFCQYEFYAAAGELREDEESDGMEGIGEVIRDAGDMQVKEKKKKLRVFKTREVEQRTQKPAWEYKVGHTVEIDEDMLLKLQSESLAVAVFGMQEGREKFGAKIFGGAKEEKKALEKAVVIEEQEINKLSQQDPAMAEKLKALERENAKLMKLLGEREAQVLAGESVDQVAGRGGEGFCAVTCSLF